MPRRVAMASSSSSVNCESLPSRRASICWPASAGWAAVSLSGTKRRSGSSSMARNSSLRAFSRARSTGSSSIASTRWRKPLNSSCLTRDQAAETRRRQCDFAAGSGTRLFLECMENMHGVRQSGDVDSAESVCRIAHPDFPYAFADGRHRLPVFRPRSIPQARNFLAHIDAHRTRKASYHVQAVAQKPYGLQRYAALRETMPPETASRQPVVVGKVRGSFFSARTAR